MRKVVKTYGTTVVIARNQKRQRGLDHSMPITGTRGAVNEATVIRRGFTRRVTRCMKDRHRSQRGGALTGYLPPLVRPDTEAMVLAASLARLFSLKTR
jgi:hypothetical protein